MQASVRSKDVSLCLYREEHEWIEILSSWGPLAAVDHRVWYVLYTSCYNSRDPRLVCRIPPATRASRASSGGKIDVGRRSVHWQRLVAIDLSSDYGKELMVTFGFKLTYDAFNFEINTDAGHILGTIMRKHNKTNRYEVVWQFTSLGETIVPLSAVLDGHKEAERLSCVRQSSSTKAKAKNKAIWGKKVNKENIDALLRELSDDGEEKGAPSSDGSVTDDDDHESEEDSDWELFDPPNSPREEETYAEISLTCDEKSNAEKPSSHDIDGLHWEFNGTIKELSPMMMPSTNTHMKPGKEHLFESPVSSMMAIFPLLFWDKIVEEINRYAVQKIRLHVKMKTNSSPVTRMAVAVFTWHTKGLCCYDLVCVGS
jgi:hypothetical protein